MNRPLKIQIAELKPREHQLSDEELESTLKRLGAPAGAPCERNCDCMIGLVCRDRACTENW